MKDEVLIPHPSSQHRLILPVDETGPSKMKKLLLLRSPNTQRSPTAEAIFSDSHMLQPLINYSGLPNGVEPEFSVALKSSNKLS